jgi:tetratricopeptide (TPR) repeat protein
MNRLRACVLLFAAPAAVAAAAQAQVANRPAQTEDEKLSAELDALIARQEYARAEQIVRQRLSSGGDPARVNFQIGKIYFAHQVWQRSAAFLEKSLQSKGANDEAHQLLGLAYRELHRPEDAEAQLVEAAKENPANRTNVYFAGHQLLLNGKFEAALPYLYRALDAEPLHSQALQAVALAQARLGNYGLAESYYRKAIDSLQASGDDQYSALLNLSVLLLLGHDPARLEDGLHFAGRAGKLKPDSSIAHFLAGKALFKLRRLQEASAELELAAKLNPEDRKPHFLLARIYDRLGQHDRARKERNDIARIQERPGQAGMATVDAIQVTPE